MALSGKQIVALSIAALIGAIVVPTALEQIFQVDTTNWSAATVAVWNLWPILILIGIVMKSY